MHVIVMPEFEPRNKQIKVSVIKVSLFIRLSTNISDISVQKSERTWRKTRQIWKSLISSMQACINYEKYIKTFTRNFFLQFCFEFRGTNMTPRFQTVTKWKEIHKSQVQNTCSTKTTTIHHKLPTLSYYRATTHEQQLRENQMHEKGAKKVLDKN